MTFATHGRSNFFANSLMAMAVGLACNTLANLFGRVRDTVLIGTTTAVVILAAWGFPELNRRMGLNYDQPMLALAQAQLTEADALSLSGQSVDGRVPRSGSAESRDVAKIARAVENLLCYRHGCFASVELIRWAKSRGVQVTAEVTPHHLLLTDDLAASYDPGNWFVMGEVVESASDGLVLDGHVEGGVPGRPAEPRATGFVHPRGEARRDAPQPRAGTRTPALLILCR